MMITKIHFDFGFIIYSDFGLSSYVGVRIKVERKIGSGFEALLLLCGSGVEFIIWVLGLRKG